jgi:zinc protease
MRWTPFVHRRCRRIGIPCSAALLCVFWVSMQAGAAAFAQDLPTAASVLDKYVEVTGGKGAYEKLRNETAKGTVEILSLGLKGTILVRAATPNKSYSSLEMTGAGIMEEGTDGVVAWERSSVQGPRLKAGEELATALRESAFNAHVRWRELFAKAEVRGIENEGGRPCYTVVLTPAVGKPVTQWYDRESGLLVKISTVVVNPMGDVPSETQLSNYREVSGVRVPHTLKHKVLSQEIVVNLETIEFNAELPSNAFDLPEDVRSLAAKTNPQKN